MPFIKRQQAGNGHLLSFGRCQEAQSRRLLRSALGHTIRTPIKFALTDLGNSCFSKEHVSDFIQTCEYKAPEVLLGAGYNAILSCDGSSGLALPPLVTLQTGEEWLRRPPEASSHFLYKPQETSSGPLSRMPCPSSVCLQQCPPNGACWAPESFWPQMNTH